MEQNLKTIMTIVRGYFNIMPDKENESDIISSISKGVVFHGANLWVLIFAIFIASLGLNVNSTAVIIGAMLISPLMGPIIGMGLGIGINDLDLFKRAFKNYVVATGISVLTATLYFLITPLSEAQSELLARTSPTLYDVLIAFFGGMAGIVALSTKGKGNVIPGVAIATALMPPLCTAGYGLAMGNPYYFFGAFYLFFINTVFICLATYVGVRMMKFEKKRFMDSERFFRVRKYIIGIVVVTMLPAAWLTVGIIRKSIFNSNVARFVKTELSFKGTQIISDSADRKEKTLSVVAVGKEITQSELRLAEERMANYGLDGFRLNVIQGTQSDSLLELNNQLATITSTNTQKLLSQSAEIRKLQQIVESYEQYDLVTTEIRGEVKALYPSVKTIGVNRFVEASVDSGQPKELVVAVIGIEKPQKGTTFDAKRFSNWLQARIKADTLKLITNIEY